MDIDLSTCWIKLDIAPMGADAPRMCVKFNEDIVFNKKITALDAIEYHTQLAQGHHCLSIELLEKSDHNADQALKITGLSINGIEDKRFIWRGIYRPRYPKIWYQQQLEIGNVMADELTNTDYLGWNGIWRLHFTAPVFTWIHQIQNLGWIYD